MATCDYCGDTLPLPTVYLAAARNAAGDCPARSDEPCRTYRSWPRCVPYPLPSEHGSGSGCSGRTRCTDRRGNAHGLQSW